MAKIIIFSEKDYSGSLNILKSEKRLLQRAYKQSDGDTKKMSKLLEISETLLLLKFISHFSLEKLVDKHK